jgi:hypothetical protein
MAMSFRWLLNVYQSVRDNRNPFRNNRESAENLEKLAFSDNVEPPISWGTGVMLLPRIVWLKVFLKKTYAQRYSRRSPEEKADFW